jgi:CHAD domain-containing protein
MRLKGKDWQLIEPGLKRSYATARHTARKLRADTEVAVIHEWRTTAKRLLHQLQLIRRVVEKSHSKLLLRLTKLCKVLGTFHDMNALAANPAVAKMPAIQQLITDKMDRQRTVIQQMAGEIFSEHTRSFISSVRTEWKKWRK